ncbi:MAG: ABC transporter ATP-binding protein, partial [Rikenellaceae bacterium]
QFIVTNTIQVMFREPLLIISYFVALMAISVKLTIFTVLVLPVTALAIGFVVKRLRHYAHRSQETIGEMLTISDEAISGIKVVKSYNITDYIVQKYIDKGSYFSWVQRKMASRQQLASPVSEFLGVSAITIILIYGGGLVADKLFDASAFIAYIAIFSQVTRPARAITDAFSSIHQGLAAGERVMELMDMKPDIVDDPKKIHFDSFKDKIEFKDVHFSYEEREVIKGVSFTIKKGETVALVGASGGGKSTITDLLSRFYDVNSGSITVDGIDIRDYYLSSLRNHVGTVSQDVVLFNDTIKANIALGKLGATDEEIVTAAKIANAHEFILEAPKGYDTNIGDRGAKLSGGQRQRLSIARAVLKNPDILILDEATSALDTQSEKVVQEALNSLLYGRTSLVVA